MIRPDLSPLPQGEDVGFAAGEDLACLFPALDVYHDVDFRSAALNMATDEALLETAVVPSIRFYEWDQPALSFGYFGKFEDVASYRRDTVRRWTGGGIVFHGEDLTYSLVIPASTPAFEESSMSIYQKVHRALAAALAANGHVSELATDAAPKISESCFANPVRADVLSNGRKIAGAAQRRTRRGLLQQGSIQNAEFGSRLTDLFAKALCRERYWKEFDAALIVRAQEIAAQKYGTSAWLRRR
jgi:lipoyl(octanoyl) transferase